MESISAGPLSWPRLLESLGVRYGLSGPVLRDTARLSQRYPPIARYGVFGVSRWPIGCDTPPPPFSERFPLGEHVKWRCDTPPPSKGVSQQYLRDTPLCDTISKGYCAIWGGISHWAAKDMAKDRPEYCLTRKEKIT